METLISYNGQVPDGLKPVPISEIVSQHRIRITLKTSKGDIVLKKLVASDRDAITMSIMDTVEGYAEIMNRISYLMERAKARKMDIETLQELKRLNAKVAPFVNRYAMACFVSPRIETVEEFEALQEALTFEEMSALDLHLADMANPRMDVKISETDIAVAQALSIPLASDLTMENMTAETRDLLVAALNRINGERNG